MLFVFDWDGTLLDSTAKIVGCMQETIASLGLEPRHDTAVKEIIGLGMAEAIKQLFPDISDSDLQRFRLIYSDLYRQADRQPCPFYAGVRSTLDALRQSGHALAVATGKSRQGLNRVLGNLAMGDFFDATRCADETRSKPHPQMLEELMTQLGFGSEQAVMVGDTSFDLDMARNARIAGIGVSYGAHTVERLRRSSPVRIIDHFKELLDYRHVCES